MARRKEDTLEVRYGVSFFTRRPVVRSTNLPVTGDDRKILEIGVGVRTLHLGSGVFVRADENTRVDVAGYGMSGSVERTVIYRKVEAPYRPDE